MNYQDSGQSTGHKTETKPLITFALFTYNQEKYIREAVEGAFAQTYSPLEIILSDDGSSDRSFEILQTLAAGYQGRHHVMVQQTPVNAGNLAHVLNVVSRAQGELIVLAAGDDISLPNRVEALYHARQETGAWGLYSRFDRINEAGEIQERDCLPGPRGTVLSNYFTDGSDIKLVHGATSAYDRRAFTLLSRRSPGPITSEDGVMTFLLNLHGKRIHFSEKSLVRYRSHSQSLTNTPQISRMDRNAIMDMQRKVSAHGKAFVNMNKYFLLLLDDLAPANSAKIKREEIENHLRFYSMLSHWIEAGFIERLRFLIASKRKSDILWILPRLFGLSTFSIIRLFSLNIKIK